MIAALKGLVALNRVLIPRLGLPRLYGSGVDYKRERGEQWQTAAEVFIAGHGDCEDLSAVRVAELQLEGEKARAWVIQVGTGAYHAVVRREDGSIEDPSKVCRRLIREGRRNVHTI
jgi:hypothetical protein